MSLSISPEFLNLFLSQIPKNKRPSFLKSLSDSSLSEILSSILNAALPHLADGFQQSDISSIFSALKEDEQLKKNVISSLDDALNFSGLAEKLSDLALRVGYHFLFDLAEQALSRFIEENPSSETQPSTSLEPSPSFLLSFLENSPLAQKIPFLKKLNHETLMAIILPVIAHIREAFADGIQKEDLPHIFNALSEDKQLRQAITTKIDDAIELQGWKETASDLLIRSTYHILLKLISELLSSWIQRATTNN